MAVNSGTVDLLNQQYAVIGAQNGVVADMKALATQAAGTTDQGQLIKIQADIDDDKRKYEALKSINETLKGAQDDATKFPQAR